MSWWMDWEQVLLRCWDVLAREFLGCGAEAGGKVGSFNGMGSIGSHSSCFPDMQELKSWEMRPR